MSGTAGWGAFVGKTIRTPFDPPDQFLILFPLNLWVLTTQIAFCRSEADQKTVRGTVFPTNAPHPTVHDTQAQVFQLFGHPGAAIAAQTGPVLIADMR